MSGSKLPYTFSTHEEKTRDIGLFVYSSILFDEIEFVCEGVDEEEALKALVEAIENGLGE